MDKGTKHIVGFSGGIDSQACARWVLNRFPKEDVILLNSDAGGNEHQLTTEFIDEYSEKVHPVIKVSAIVSDLWAIPGMRVYVSENRAVNERGFSADAALSFGDMMDLMKRGPSSQRQFCTSVLKLAPQKRWILENLKGVDYQRYAGVRRDESRSRKDAAFVSWDSFYDCELNQPIADWTKSMCFDYVKAHGEPINPLYLMGMSRVGCFPCVNWNKEDLLSAVTRSPEFVVKIDRWEKQSERTFFPPIVPGMRMNFIHDVIEWAKTSRGGRQQPFPIFHEREACESKYGLCE